MNFRAFAGLCLMGVMLAGCQYTPVPDPSLNAVDKAYMAKVERADLDPQYQRYEVEDPTGEPPGTIVVDTKQNLLWYVLPHKKAIRYGVATGNEAYGWTGVATVKRMAEWPRWMPPKEMVARWPYLKPTYDAGGLAGGPDNPLGARALYLYDSKGHDTLYRIHGTNEPEKIGRSVSSGCIRMRDIDVIDLYKRVKLGTRVVVK